MKKRKDYGYNERLFSSGLRKYLHLSRFYWLSKWVNQFVPPNPRVLEVGCFDGKAIQYLPTTPKKYLGLDANWEGGLELARERWQHESQFEFRVCHSPDEMGISGNMFDISICMDTLEHVPPDIVEPYLEQISKATTQYVFITVPNEKGIVFFFKYLIKKICSGDVQSYTIHEVINATLGRMDKVARKEHKGFDYEKFLESVSKYFQIHDVSGYPFGFLPKCLNFGIGIVGKKHPHL